MGDSHDLTNLLDSLTNTLAAQSEAHRRDVEELRAQIIRGAQLATPTATPASKLCSLHERLERANATIAQQQSFISDVSAVTATRALRSTLHARAAQADFTALSQCFQIWAELGGHSQPPTGKQLQRVMRQLQLQQVQAADTISMATTAKLQSAIVSLHMHCLPAAFWRWQAVAETIAVSQKTIFAAGSTAGASVRAVAAVSSMPIHTAEVSPSNGPQPDDLGACSTSAEGQWRALASTTHEVLALRAELARSVEVQSRTQADLSALAQQVAHLQHSNESGAAAGGNGQPSGQPALRPPAALSAPTSLARQATLMDDGPGNSAAPDEMRAVRAPSVSVAYRSSCDLARSDSRSAQALQADSTQQIAFERIRKALQNAQPSRPPSDKVALLGIRLTASGHSTAPRAGRNPPMSPAMATASAFLLARHTTAVAR